MSHSRRVLTAMASVWLLGSGMLCLPAGGRDAKLVLHPQKAPAEVGKFSLLPPESVMIDGDALPLYEKAIQALPDKAGDAQIREWLKMPVDQLPLDQVEETLTKRMESLKSVAKAVKCRQCNWPQPSPTMEPGTWAEYNRLARVVELWARLEIANEGYEGAILALQTGFGMTRHLSLPPTLGQRAYAVRIGRLMCREVEELVQREGAPNLSLALADLPELIGDIEKVLADDKKVVLSEWEGKISREEIERGLKMSHDQMRASAKGYETHLAAIQCVEAIRSYAASHDGKLPGALADIAEVSVPKDPTSDGPFRYTQTDSEAVLESSLIPGAQEEDRIHFEISIKN